MGVEKIFSFTSWDTDHPRDRHPGERIDAQFDAHANAIRALEARIEALVRADGKLHDNVLPFATPPHLLSGGNVATLSAAAAEDWAEVAMEWAEHMPDTIPGNILATNAITGDHWSARWWANQAARTTARGTVAAVKLQNFTFNGVAVTFPLLDTTAAPIVPATNVSQLSIVVDGVTQEPGVDFVLALGGASVTFTTAPAADARNFAIYFLQGATNVADVGTVGAVLFSTRTAAAAAIIPVAVQAIATGGYVAAGDAGGSLYYRIAGPTAGGFQSADGAWWALAGNPVNVRWQSLGDADAALTLTLGDTGAANRFGLTSPLTAARTVSLPLANSVPKGTSLAVADLVGGVSNANTLTVVRAGSDLIDGQASAVLSSAYDGLTLVSDGSSKWHIESGWRNRASKTRFWSNIDNGAAITTPRTLMHRERMFVGAAAEVSNLSLSGNPTFGWLTPQKGENYLQRDAHVAIVSADGASGVAVASRASDKVNPAAVTIGLASNIIGDGPNAWGGYFSLSRESSSSFQAIEIDVRNCFAGTVSTTPYGLGSGPNALWVACGGGGYSTGGNGADPTGDSGAAMVVLCNSGASNNFRFTKGIVFRDTSLANVNGADGEAGSAAALEMARGHSIRWYSSGGAFGALKVAVSSRLNSTDPDWAMYWLSDTLTFARNGATENVLLMTGVVSAANYLQVTNAAATVAPGMSALGTDINIDMTLTPKGNGLVRSAKGIKASNIAIPAGGTVGAGLMVSSAANFGVFFGSGVPTLAAAKGSLYLRSDAGVAAERLYVNTNGTTGWTNFTAAA